MPPYPHRLESKDYKRLYRPNGYDRPSSDTVKLLGEGLAQTLKDTIERSHREAEKIFAISKELDGNPNKSSAYLEAITLNRMAHEMYELILGHHTYTLAVGDVTGDNNGS